MSRKKIPDEELKKLYDAIVHSIMNSDEIKSIVKDLKNQNKINAISTFALFIKVEELLNCSLMPIKADFPSTRKKKEKKVLKSSEPGQFIDGEKLSKSEIAFEEYCRKNFDEGKWLLENKIFL